MEKQKSHNKGGLKSGSKLYTKEEVHTMLAKCKKTSVREYRKKRKLDKSVETQRENFESFKIDSNDDITDDDVSDTASATDI